MFVFVPFFGGGIYFYVPKPLQGAYLDMSSQKVGAFGGVRLAGGKDMDGLSFCRTEGLWEVQAFAPYPMEENLRHYVSHTSQPLGVRRTSTYSWSVVAKRSPT